METIYFYSTVGEYGCFSNFSQHGFEIEGQYWSTVEHYFQAQKFAGTEHELTIQKAKTPKDAKRLGRSRKWPLRKDWEQVKDEIMWQGVLKKFQTHENIQQILLGTGTAQIVENAPSDYYWGCGANGSGKNMLGVILMEVRDMLRGSQI